MAQPAQENLVIGPRPYNRFLGNPPKGKTPEEAFKDENSYDWIEEVNMQPLRDTINNLMAENNTLKAKVATLEAVPPPKK